MADTRCNVGSATWQIDCRLGCSACAYPIKALTFVKNLIPPQFRRSVLMAAIAALMYWLFLSGSSTSSLEAAEENLRSSEQSGVEEPSAETELDGLDDPEAW